MSRKLLSIFMAMLMVLSTFAGGVLFSSPVMAQDELEPEPDPGIDPEVPEPEPDPGIDPEVPDPEPDPGIDPEVPDPEPDPGIDPEIPDPTDATDGITGTCAWRITSEGVLEIGTAGGDCTLDEYNDPFEVPWNTNGTDILSVDILGTVRGNSEAMGLFQGLGNCTSIDLTGFDTSNVTNMDWMFRDCTSLTSISLPSGFGADATNMDSMFYSCSSLESLTLPAGFGANADVMEMMFSDCDSLESITLPAGFGANARDMSYMFMSCLSLQTISVSEGTDFSSLDTDVSDDMFINCTSLVGGAGTTYDESNTNGAYAHIDGGVSNPGYFTLYTAPTPAPSAFTQYTAVTGTSTPQLSKYLVLATDADVPNATFDFSIAAGTGQTAGTGTMEVLAPTSANGVTGTPSIASISYSGADTTAKTDAPDSGVTLAAGQSYVKKQTSINFSSVSFAEPGIYRYVITEAANPVADEAIFSMDAQAATAGSKTRYLDIYVTDSNDGNKILSISNYILRETAGAVPAGSDNGTAYSGDAVADKSAGFVNVYLSQNVAFAKTVTGNQGSRDKYFDFTVALTGLQSGHTYQVDISNADATSGSTTATKQANRGQTNASSITTGANETTATLHYYLRDGQSVEIKGLPKGATYTVSEDYEDYKQTAGAGTINTVAFNDAATGTINASDIHTGFTNTRNGVVPTGLIVSALGTIGLVAIAGAGLISKRRKEDEE